MCLAQTIRAAHGARTGLLLCRRILNLLVIEHVHISRTVHEDLCFLTINWVIEHQLLRQGNDLLDVGHWLVHHFIMFSLVVYENEWSLVKKTYANVLGLDWNSESQIVHD